MKSKKRSIVHFVHWQFVWLIVFLFGNLLLTPLGTSLRSELPPKPEESISKPLLRIWPIFRLDECDMAIRPFVCKRCIDSGRQYAQRIHFYESGLYREHGCYEEGIGFYPGSERIGPGI